MRLEREERHLSHYISKGYPGIQIAAFFAQAPHVYHGQARFQSPCLICHRPIEIDAMIYAAKDFGAAHEACTEAIWETIDLEP